MSIRQTCSALLLVLVLALYGPDATAASRLEELGWSSARLKSAGEAAGEGLTHSMLLAHRSGEILWRWGPVEEKLQIFSIRKSLVSALFGIYAHRDQVDLDATLADLGIDDKQGLTVQERQASVRELLAARSGVYHPAAYETPGMASNRPERGAHAHGEHWFYNNWDFNALNTIFEKTTGVKIPAAFRGRIADPAGMQDFRQEDVLYILEDASEPLRWSSG